MDHGYGYTLSILTFLGLPELIYDPWRIVTTFQSVFGYSSSIRKFIYLNFRGHYHSYKTTD
jgi:hypothetical protein